MILLVINILLMKIMYIFPHPDDESFGPAAAMHQQVQQGHEVYLLTLTKGGATKVRHKLNLSIEEMGEVRHNEMLCVEKRLGLAGMTVLDLPDSALKEMNPIEIERVVRQYIEKIKPDVVVSYPVHGISGFHDHLVMHAVAKRVFCAMRADGMDYPKRLAFFTLDKEQAEKGGKFNLSSSPAALIDCVVPISEEDKQALRDCLDCYKTYQATIKETSVAESIGDVVNFELFEEEHEPPLMDVTIGL